MIRKAFMFLVLGLIGFSSKTVAQNLVNGKKIYETRCLVCHQADGGGVPNMNALWMVPLMWLVMILPEW
jgi:cytochrome c